VANLTFILTSKLVTLLPGTPLIDPAQKILGTSNFSVKISSSCSGYQGIGLMAAFIAAYLFLKRKELRFPAAFILWPVSIVLAWLSNALRIVALIGVGTLGFQNIALGGFHAKAGWVIFCALALGIVAVSRALPVFSMVAVKNDRHKKIRTWNPTTVYLLPFLIAIAASMITGLFSETGFDIAYPVRIIASGLVLLIYRDALRKDNRLSTSSFSWVVLLAGIAVAVFWIGIDQFLTGGRTVHTIPPELSALTPFTRTLWILFKIFGSCLVIPVIEEFAFRGFLQRRLIQADFTTVPYRTFTWKSFLLSSIVFGLMHGDRWFAGIIAGMAYSLVMYRKGRLTDAVVAHAVSNSVIALYVFITGQWGFWI
jgi:exosortase E/protease (VPEID-CTERM system)